MICFTRSDIAHGRQVAGNVPGSVVVETFEGAMYTVLLATMTVMTSAIWEKAGRSQLGVNQFHPHYGSMT
ncbi:Uu.00g100820.m01.CDS01 [Anthostomella pinea]|uniref:Uu.00g100820.m01.CDS01 n=1 Tax=Anthostomella pinea TaxID=933095 RepID=A0AAI8VDK9_9PEZI|nr:Uu.00g100820.m01.CDS01 [Anthostomella pinea]